MTFPKTPPRGRVQDDDIKMSSPDRVSLPEDIDEMSEDDIVTPTSTWQPKAPPGPCPGAPGWSPGEIQSYPPSSPPRPDVESGPATMNSDDESEDVAPETTVATRKNGVSDETEPEMFPERESGGVKTQVLVIGGAVGFGHESARIAHMGGDGRRSSSTGVRSAGVGRNSHWATPLTTQQPNPPSPRRSIGHVPLDQDGNPVDPDQAV